MERSPHTNAATATEDARVGTVVADRYRIEALLGVGGMGTVYRAQHVRMQKTVALKLLHREMTSVFDMAARFEREAVAAGKIDHPNVATATDFGRLEDGSLYLVLEYVNGRSLSAVLEEGPLSVDRALAIAGQIAAALEAAHQSGIVHRDLKPDNVMLVEQSDGTDRVKVLDFGIAKMAPEGQASNQTLTKFGTVMGTVSYMSPEQAVGQHVDARTDLYALGVILFELLTGRVPFHADELAQVLAKQITEPPPPLPASVPPEIGNLVFALMEKSPRDRPGSASEVVDELRRLQGLPPRSRKMLESAPTVVSGRSAVMPPSSTPDATIPALDVTPNEARNSSPRAALIFVGVASALGVLGGLALAGGGSDARATRTTSVPALSVGSTVPKLAGTAAAPPPEAAAQPSAEPAATASVSGLAASASNTEVTTSSSSTPRTRTVNTKGTRTTRKTTKTATKSRRTIKKKKRRTGPGGIYIPPPSEWF